MLSLLDMRLAAVDVSPAQIRHPLLEAERSQKCLSRPAGGYFFYDRWKKAGDTPRMLAETPCAQEELSYLCWRYESCVL